MGEIGTSLGLAEFAFNEERIQRKTDLLTRIGRLEGALFQEEGKGWEPAWRENETLAKGLGRCSKPCWITLESALGKGLRL